MAKAWLTWSRSSRDQHRTISIVASMGLVAAVGLAVVGLPPIDTHGPLHGLGIMDPFCGGTRAARLTMQGQWALAWYYNPLGVIAVLSAGAGVVRLVLGGITRTWVNATLTWTLRRRRFVVVGIAALFVVMEVRQQLLADMLVRGS